MHRFAITLCASALVLVAGCADNHEVDVDSGMTPAGDSALDPHTDAAVGSGLDTGSPPPPDVGVIPIRDAGIHPLADGGPPGDGAGDVWTGYIESFMFASGSDHVRIVFDSPTGTGSQSGVVIFGDAPAPPPATDPNIGYPPGFGEGSFSLGPSEYIAEGFAYRFDGAMVSSSRVQISLDTGSVWRDWCGLQYPVLVDPGGTTYGCLPNGGFGSGPDGCTYGDPNTGETIAIDCGRLALCGGFGGVCTCDASACTAGTVSGISFDFHVTGSDGSGTVQLRGMHNVYFTR